MTSQSMTQCPGIIKRALAQGVVAQASEDVGVAFKLETRKHPPRVPRVLHQTI